MKIILTSKFTGDKSELILWIDKDGDVRLKINDTTVCVDRLDIKAALRVADSNPEDK